MRRVPALATVAANAWLASSTVLELSKDETNPPPRHVRVAINRSTAAAMTWAARCKERDPPLTTNTTPMDREAAEDGTTSVPISSFLERVDATLASSRQNIKVDELNAQIEVETASHRRRARYRRRGPCGEPSTAVPHAHARSSTTGKALHARPCMLTPVLAADERVSSVGVTERTDYRRRPAAVAHGHTGGAFRRAPVVASGPSSGARADHFQVHNRRRSEVCPPADRSLQRLETSMSLVVIRRSAGLCRPEAGNGPFRVNILASSNSCCQS